MGHVVIKLIFVWNLRLHDLNVSSVKYSWSVIGTSWRVLFRGRGVMDAEILNGHGLYLMSFQCYVMCESCVDMILIWWVPSYVWYWSPLWTWVSPEKIFMSPEWIYCWAVVRIRVCSWQTSVNNGVHHDEISSCSLTAGQESSQQIWTGDSGRLLFSSRCCDAGFVQRRMRKTYFGHCEILPNFDRYSKILSSVLRTWVLMRSSNRFS